MVTAGQEFLPVNKRFYFTNLDDNDSEYCFFVTILGDDQIEENETFYIVLSSPTGDTLNGSMVNVTLIHDGDGKN